MAESGSPRSEESNEKKSGKLNVEQIMDDLECQDQKFGFYKIMRTLQREETA